MAISQATLQNYAGRAPLGKSASIVREAKIAGKQTAFLCHSHLDGDLAKGVQGFLQDQGWDVYIDWEDTTLPDTPDRMTAEQIQRKVRDLDWFLFLATANSMRSRWCPWEIGYADGVKQYDAILIIPTTDSLGAFYGNEYLRLYRQITGAEGGGYGAFRPNNGGCLLKSLSLP